MARTVITAQPFFANDMWGLLKVLLVVVAPVVAGVLAGIWKILRGPLQEADRQLLEEIRRVDDAMRRDTRGLGDRVAEAEEHVSALAADVSALQSEQALSTADRITIRGEIGELKRAVHSLTAAGVETRTEIITALNEARREHAAALGAATQRQAEHDSRMAQRVMRVETLLETSGVPGREMAPPDRQIARSR